MTTVWILTWADKATGVLGGVIAIFGSENTAKKAWQLLELQQHPSRTYSVAEYSVYP